MTARTLKMSAQQTPDERVNGKVLFSQCARWPEQRVRVARADNRVAHAQTGHDSQVLRFDRFAVMVGRDCG